jgi:hypothetical protein
MVVALAVVVIRPLGQMRQAKALAVLAVQD